MLPLLKKLNINRYGVLLLTLRLLSISLNIFGLFAVDFVFGNESSAYYQNTINIILIMSAVSTLGMNQYFVFAFNNQSDRDELLSNYLVFGLFLIGVVNFLFFSASASTGLYEHTDFYFVPFSLLLIYSATLKVQNSTLKAVFFESVLPYTIFVFAVAICITKFRNREFEVVFNLVLVYLSLPVILYLLYKFRHCIDIHLLNFSGLKKYIRIMMAGGLVNFVSTLLSVLLNKIELFLLIYLGLATEAGYFVKGFMIANVSALPMSFMASHFFPQFTKLVAQQKMVEACFFFLSCRKTIVLATLGTSVCAAIVTYVYFEFFQKANAPQSTIFWVWAFVSLGCLISAAFGDFHYGLVGLGRSGQCALVNFLGVCSAFGVSLICIEIYGAVGAAMSVFMTHVMKSLAGRFFLARVGALQK